MSVMDRIRTWFASPEQNGRGDNSDGVKLLQMMHDGRQQLVGAMDAMLPATQINYAAKVGDGLGSSVLAGPLHWLMRNFPQAPPLVQRLRKEQWMSLPLHPLTDLLAKPNDFYGGRELWMATILDLAFGNAYWLKIRNEARDVVQLWWVPANTMIPRWPADGKIYISHYEYRPGGMPRALGIDSGMTIIDGGGGGKPIDVQDVVHFRFGLDPRNSRLGLSPLGALMRDVFTDDEASNFSSVILQNFGIVGVVIAPKEKGTASRDDVKATKEYIQERFTGDRRGKTLALGQPTEVTLLQYNLQAFDMSPLRDVSEERVCAALGLPAAVVGFGTGLQTTKVGATMREMRRMAWTDCVMPLQTMIAEQVGRQLLPEVMAQPNRTRLIFDTSHVPALMEDQVEKHARVRADYLAGMIQRKTAKEELGYPIAQDDSDEVYAQPMNVMLMKPGDVPITAETQGDGDDDSE